MFEFGGGGGGVEDCKDPFQVLLRHPIEGTLM